MVGELQRIGGILFSLGNQRRLTRPLPKRQRSRASPGRTSSGKPKVASRPGPGSRYVQVAPRSFKPGDNSYAEPQRVVAFLGVGLAVPTMDPKAITSPHDSTTAREDIENQHQRKK